jgi:hypothetical protein
VEGCCDAITGTDSYIKGELLIYTCNSVGYDVMHGKASDALGLGCARAFFAEGTGGLEVGGA